MVDAWVKSGHDDEHRASIYLVGGRPYTVRVEFSKSIQGIPDKKKQNVKPSAPASIVVSWKTPSGVEEPIPARSLMPDSSADTYACSAPFPPDDRSYGWERGTTVSKEWDEATTEAAIEAAEYVAAAINDPGRHAGTEPAIARKNCVTFCRKFAERAFRRPLTPDETRLFVDKQFDNGLAAKNPEIGV